MYFGMKSTLKSNRNHTPKQAIIWMFVLCEPVELASLKAT